MFRRHQKRESFFFPQSEVFSRDGALRDTFNGELKSQRNIGGSAGEEFFSLKTKFFRVGASSHHLSLALPGRLSFRAGQPSCGLANPTRPPQARLERGAPDRENWRDGSRKNPSRSFGRKWAEVPPSTPWWRKIPDSSTSYSL